LLASCITLLGLDVSLEKKVDLIASTVGMKLPSDEKSVPVIDGVYSLLAFFGTLVPCRSLVKYFSEGIHQAGVQSTCLVS
jgi:hypothetical protein